MSVSLRKECTNEYEEKIFRQINKLFLNREYCDVVLVAGNGSTRIPAHRIILSSSSDYFMELLESVQTPEVTLDDVDGDILKILLDFIYSSNLELCCDTVDRIMRTATRLKVNAVVMQCSDFLAARLSNQNCLGVVVFADREDYVYLREKALMYASEHFMEVIEEEPFLQLEADHVCMLIRRNDLWVNSEEDVFRALNKWLQQDIENQEKFTYKLLVHLRFPLLKTEFIANEVEKICQSPESQTVIIKAFKYHLSPTSRSVFPPELSEPRNEVREIVLISGVRKEEETIVAEQYDPLVGVWFRVQLPSKPMPGWYSKGLFAAGKVYLAGTTTINQGPEFSCVDCLDWTTKQFTELPPMPESRYSFGMAAINGVLYAVGGTHGRNSLSIVEKWDPSSPEKWQEVASMGAERSQPGVAVLHGLLYAIGCNNDFASNTFEFYDPQTNTWAELAPPGQARTAVCLAAVNGSLYAVGGRTKGGICNMVERYDPKTDSWTEITPSQKNRHYQQCTASVNRLVVLVEDIQGRFINVFEEYDPETEQWKCLNPLKRSYGPITLISK